VLFLLLLLCQSSVRILCSFVQVVGGGGLE